MPPEKWHGHFYGASIGKPLKYRHLPIAEEIIVSSLKDVDPEIYREIALELERQQTA